MSHVNPDDVTIVLKNDCANIAKLSESTSISRPQYFIVPIYGERYNSENSARINVHIDMDQQAQTRAGDIVLTNIPQAGYLPFSIVPVMSQDKICLFLTVQDEKTCVDVIIKEEQKSWLTIIPPLKLTKTSRGKFSKETLKSIANTICFLKQSDNENDRKVRSSLSTNIGSSNNYSDDELEE